MISIQRKVPLTHFCGESRNGCVPGQVDSNLLRYDLPGFPMERTAFAHEFTSLGKNDRQAPFCPHVLSPRT